MATHNILEPLAKMNIESFLHPSTLIETGTQNEPIHSNTIDSHYSQLLCSINSRHWMNEYQIVASVENTELILQAPGQNIFISQSVHNLIFVCVFLFKTPFLN